MRGTSGGGQVDQVSTPHQLEGDPFARTLCARGIATFLRWSELKRGFSEISGERRSRKEAIGTESAGRRPAPQPAEIRDAHELVSEERGNRSATQHRRPVVLVDADALRSALGGNLSTWKSAQVEPGRANRRYASRSGLDQRIVLVSLIRCSSASNDRWLISSAARATSVSAHRRSLR